MDFTLSDEQHLIQQTARSLLRKECSLDLIRSAWTKPEIAASLWRDHLQDWLGLVEQPLVDTVLFMEEYGHALAPGVFYCSLLAATVAAAVDHSLSGSATVAIAGTDGCWIPNSEPNKHFVPCAAQVNELIVVDGSHEAPRVAILPVEQAGLVEVENLDQLRPQYRVTLKDTIRGTQISPQSWQHIARRALVTCAAELIGVGRHLLDAAVEYARERQQFGKPIGAFQGLQWKLVDVSLELERAAAAVSWAAMCVDASVPEAARAVHIAKLEAGSAARRCARTSLQVHGGIGYTWEHGLHFWLRRAYAGDAFMGPSDYHARRLADLVFAD
jgi:hypothetical protein